MARILRVCDVFIALTSKRVYRNAFDPKSALEIMIDEVGDYDMHVFLAFQRVVHRDVFQEGIASLKEIRDERQLEPLKLFVKEAAYGELTDCFLSEKTKVCKSRTCAEENSFLLYFVFRCKI